MRLTTRGRYAVTAMMDLVLHGNGDPVPLAEVAERQRLSLAYLEQLFAKLRRAGLVQSTRGPGGGYHLARSADAIYVGEVVTAVDEAVDNTQCGGNMDCQGSGPCLTHQLWADLNDCIQAFLFRVSLAEAIDRYRAACANAGVEPREPQARI